MNLSDGPLEFQVVGNGSRVVVRVRAFEHPECEDYGDGNWLLADLQVKLPGFSADFEMSARAPELQAFLDELKAIRQNLAGTASYKMMEPSLNLRGMMAREARSRGPAQLNTRLESVVSFLSNSRAINRTCQS